MCEEYRDDGKHYFSYKDKLNLFYSSEAGMGDILTCIADKVAFECGDTYIEYTIMSPYAQWQRIIKILNNEGFTIIQKND